MKVIELVNHNNKLGNDVFLHIDAEPSAPLKLPILVEVKEIAPAAISALEMLEKGVKPTTAFRAEIIDLARVHLSNLSNLFTYASHGCTYDEFMEKHYNGKLEGFTLGIYVFKKLK